jgi:hypothetical protein
MYSNRYTVTNYAGATMFVAKVVVMLAVLALLALGVVIRVCNTLHVRV